MNWKDKVDEETRTLRRYMGIFEKEGETQTTWQDKIDKEMESYPWGDMCVEKTEKALCTCQDTSDSDEDYDSWDDVFLEKHSKTMEEVDSLADIPSEDIMVHHPPHYERNGHECIDWIEMALTPEEFKGYLKGCAYKYQWRHEEKGHRERDLQKAQWYLRKLESLGEK